MAIDAIVQPLLKLEIFQGLKPLQITEIVRRAYRVVYKPGDVILQEGAMGEGAIVIVSGDAVRLSGLGDEPAAMPIPAGSILAELAMLVEQVHSATIVAHSSVRALRIAREDLHQLMAEDARLADHFTQRVTARLSVVLEELRRIDSEFAGSAIFSAASGEAREASATAFH